MPGDGGVMGKGSEASSSTGGEGPPARGHSCPGCPSPEHTVAPAMPLCSRRSTQQAQSAAARPASDVRDANGTRRTHPAFWRSSAWVIELAMLELDVSARGTVGDGDEDAGRRRCWGEQGEMAHPAVPAEQVLFNAGALFSYRWPRSRWARHGGGARPLRGRGGSQ